MRMCILESIIQHKMADLRPKEGMSAAEKPSYKNVLKDKKKENEKAEQGDADIATLL
jgi:hypothetical protein